MKSVEVRLVGRFRLERKIPGDHERLLYSAVHTQNQTMVFLKGDQTKRKNNTIKLSILQEGKILQTMQGGIGIPHMHWCGTEEDYNFIVLEDLSTDLKSLLKKCGKKFSLKTSLLLGIQIISILQYFHFKNFLHCQLKPSHLMMGSGSKYGKLYIVDFSSSFRFRDNQTLEHVPEQGEKKIQQRTVNMQFSSYNYHVGGIPSRKDDLISFLYLMAYFETGSLPWSFLMNIKRPQAQKSKQILEMKRQTTPKEVFQGCPDLLMLYENTLKLKFDEKPQYAYYKNVFRQRLEREGLLEDGIYDWMLLEDDEEDLNDDFEVELIPNEKQFLEKLEEEIKMKEKMENQKIVVEKKSLGHKKSPSKDKECCIF